MAEIAPPDLAPASSPSSSYVKVTCTGCGHWWREKAIPGEPIRITVLCLRCRKQDRKG